jgi:hypothetical protein
MGRACFGKCVTMNKLLFVITSVLLFSSCTVHEEINVSSEANGYYSMNMDMSPAVEMMKSMGGAGQVPDSIADKVIDSSFSMRSQIDSIDTGFTDTEKSFYYLGNTHIQMNMKEGKMIVDMKYPVANTKQLKHFFELNQEVDSISKEKQRAEGDAGDMGIAGQPSPTSMLSSFSSKGKPYIITDTSIERIAISKEELNEQLGPDMKGADMFMNQMTYSITIKLPRQVKSLQGKNIKLLDDKKTVFFSAMFSEMMTDTEASRFKISF